MAVFVKSFTVCFHGLIFRHFRLLCIGNDSCKSVLHSNVLAKLDKQTRHDAHRKSQIS